MTMLHNPKLLRNVPLTKHFKTYRKEHGRGRRRGRLRRLGPLLHLDGLGLVPKLLALLHHVLPQPVEVVPGVLEERILRRTTDRQTDSSLFLPLSFVIYLFIF